MTSELVRRLYFNGAGADFRIEIINENETKIFNVHTFVLEEVSDYFKKIFNSDTWKDSKEKKIIYNNVSMLAIDTLLRYIYFREKYMLSVPYCYFDDIIKYSNLWFSEFGIVKTSQICDIYAETIINGFNKKEISFKDVFYFFKNYSSGSNKLTKLKTLILDYLNNPSFTFKLFYSEEETKSMKEYLGSVDGNILNIN
jgi:hypothetical protein